MKNVITTVVAAALLCGAVPARAQSREHQQMAAELRIMQERLQELALANEKTLAQLAEAVKAINARLDAADAATRKALADQKVVIDDVGTQVRFVRERTQDTNTRIGTLTEEVKALSTNVSLINVPPPVPALSTDGSTPATPAVTTPPLVPVPPAQRSGLSPTRLYDTAWTDYTGGNYSLAINGFQQYLAEYPKNDKAGDAQFFIGESQVRLKKLPEAVTAFTTFIQSYPNHEQISQAYYDLGEAQRALGQIEAARTSWETVVKKYPDSSGGILAKQRLDGLPPAAAPRQP